MAQQMRWCYDCALSRWCDKHYPSSRPPCSQSMESAPSASTNSAKPKLPSDKEVVEYLESIVLPGKEVSMEDKIVADHVLRFVARQLRL
jgi:hypothetical protein